MNIIKTIINSKIRCDNCYGCYGCEENVGVVDFPHAKGQVIEEFPSLQPSASETLLVLGPWHEENLLLPLFFRGKDIPERNWKTFPYRHPSYLKCWRTLFI